MRRFVVISAATHLGAALLVAAWLWLPRPVPDEVPATVEVIFGAGATESGAAVAPPVQAPPPSAGEGPRPVAVEPPVRLGDGDVGLRTDTPPDAGMIEARADPGNRSPKYPEEAFRRHEQGRVVLRLHVDTQGRVASTEIVESSGYADLDEAARRMLVTWHFIPALRDGVAVPSYRDQAAKFVLE